MKDDFIDALRYSLDWRDEILRCATRLSTPLLTQSLEAYRQQELSWEWNEVLARHRGKGLRLETPDEYAARQTKGKTMLDTSKKYKVGSVVYKWSDLGTGKWASKEKVVYPLAMQQLYDDGLAVEVKEPFEKTFKVEFGKSIGSSDGPMCLFDLCREIVGENRNDMASVANRTFDVTIKERL